MHLDISAVKEPGAYTGYIRKKVLFLVACTAALVLLAFVSVGVGSVMIPFDEVVRTLVYHSSGNAEMIIWNIRLPRVLAATVCGVGLAAAGVVMQSVLRNPLSSPYTLGVSQAAAFGAAVAITLFGAGTIGRLISDAIVVNNPYLVTICAFLSSLVATSVILLVAKYRSTSPEVMILVGVALAALFTAGTTFLQYFSSAEQIAAIVFWTFGDVGRATWSDLAIILAVITPCLIYFMVKRWDYNALDSGDETAKSLGVNAERVRTVAMFLSSLIAAVVVSFLGIIGFIGLVSPHIVRRLIGDDQRFLLPGSCIVGGIILLGADTVARIIIAPAVLPAGVLTAFLGAPLFLYLLIRGEPVMILSVQNLSFSYNSHPVLQEVRCEARPDEIVAILGPNGAGKTTLLRCMNATLRPKTGAIMLGEQDLLSLSRMEIARSIAHVPQHTEPPRVTAFDAILLGRRPWIGMNVRQDDILKVQAIIEQLHLSGLALRHVDAMSGGELQKIVIARALVQEPRVLLLDEPTSSLDLKNQHEIMRFIRSIVHTHHLTALMTMHDLNLALHYADRFVLLKKGMVYAAGGEEVITPQLIEEVYGVPVAIRRWGGRNVVVPHADPDDLPASPGIPAGTVMGM